MGRQVDLDDILDTQGVADALGLAQRSTIRLYRQRYDDFPEPVLVKAGGRCLMWLRPDIEEWRRQHPPRHT